MTNLLLRFFNDQDYRCHSLFCLRLFQAEIINNVKKWVKKLLVYTLKKMIQRRFFDLLKAQIAETIVTMLVSKGFSSTNLEIGIRFDIEY